MEAPMENNHQMVAVETQPDDVEMHTVSVELPPTSTELPPVGAEMPPVSAELPPVSAELPPFSAELPPVSAELPPVSAELPPVGAELPPFSAELPPFSAELPPVSAELPPVSAELPPVSAEVPSAPVELPPSSVELPPFSEELQTNSVELQPANLETQPSATEMQPTNLEMQPANLEMQPANLQMQPANVEMQPTSLEMQLTNYEVQSPNLEMQEAHLEMHPSDLEMQLHPSNLEMQMHPNNLEMQMHPNNLEMQMHPLSMETEPLNIETQPNKRRKKKSVVWEHFTIENVGAGCRRACCKQCKQSFAYSTGTKVAGTSHLKRHIAKGTCPVVLRNQEKNQLSPYSAPTKMGGLGGLNDAPKRRYRTASVPYFAFDSDRCRHEIARMIIMHDYPLHIVEHPGFIAFVKNLQPRFDMVSFNTVQGDCVATYLREKQSLQKLLEGIPGRICLTLDLWTSSQTVGYVFVTGQFIDSEWKIHRKILNVVMEPYPESDSAFSHSVAACLSDWNMDGRLISLTINQSLTDAALDNLKALLSVKNPNLLGGQLLLGNCLARSFSSIAQEALRAAQDTVKKVRNSVKYVKTSESHEEKFLELKQQLQVPSTKSLALDDQTQWNTTYEMLLAASELREVFSCLDTSDPDYKEAPSMEDWRLIETLTTYLKLLFDTASLLTNHVIPTTDTFFHEIWKIQLELARASSSEDFFISNITRPMQANFDKYWKSCCLILAIAVVMDPRFKMKLVEFSLNKIYGDEATTYIKSVEDGIHELFNEYCHLPLPLTPTYVDEINGESLKPEDGGPFLSSNGLGLTDFDMYIMESTSQQSKSELDQYLEESLLPRVHEFDVIGWWKLNKSKYPTLSKMARDMLSVPVSTVGPDLVFDTVGKEMDRYRCSLRPETVEALICAKDWLQRDSLEAQTTVPIKKEFPI